MSEAGPGDSDGPVPPLFGVSDEGDTDTVATSASATGVAGSATMATGSSAVQGSTPTPQPPPQWVVDLLSQFSSSQAALLTQVTSSQTAMLEELSSFRTAGAALAKQVARLQAQLASDSAQAPPADSAPLAADAAPQAAVAAPPAAVPAPAESLAAEAPPAAVPAPAESLATVEDTAPEQPAPSAAPSVPGPPVLDSGPHGPGASPHLPSFPTPSLPEHGAEHHEPAAVTYQDDLLNEDSTTATWARAHRTSRAHDAPRYQRPYDYSPDTWSAQPHDTFPWPKSPGVRIPGIATSPATTPFLDSCHRIGAFNAATKVATTGRTAASVVASPPVAGLLPPTIPAEPPPPDPLHVPSPDLPVQPKASPAFYKDLIAHVCARIDDPEACFANMDVDLASGNDLGSLASDNASGSALQGEPIYDGTAGVATSCIKTVPADPVTLASFLSLAAIHPAVSPLETADGISEASLREDLAVSDPRSLVTGEAAMFDAEILADDLNSAATEAAELLEQLIENAKIAGLPASHEALLRAAVNLHNCRQQLTSDPPIKVPVAPTELMPIILIIQETTHESQHVLRRPTSLYKRWRDGHLHRHARRDIN